MKSFESDLAPKLEEYMRYRQNLGYVDKCLRTYLLPFDRYLKETKADWHCLHPNFFLTFRKNIKAEPSTINKVLSVVHNFFQFLLRLGLIKEDPLQDIPALKKRAYIPFIFSPHQINQILETITKTLGKTEKYFFKDLGVYLAILLMARCGLRISEPLRLLRKHYRADECTLYIEKTKFQKDRLIPIPKPVKVEIENYLSMRTCMLYDDRSPYLISPNNSGALSKKQIYKFFHWAVKDIGINQPRRLMGNTIFGSPTPHSFRHSFAVNSLKRIKEEGRSPQAALPIIAAYMGHREYRYTAVYLKVLNAQHRQELVDFNTLASEEI